MLVRLLVVMYISLAMYIGYGAFFEEEPRYQDAEVFVASGETLWDIAGRYRQPGEDIRDVVYRIRDKNGLSSGYIYPGQGLLIPVLVEDK